MEYIKSFESRKDEILRGKNRNRIEDDINGMLVELSDVRINYRINWIGNWINGIIIYLDKNDGVFNTSDIKEYLMMVENYLKQYWTDVSVRYESENSNSNYKISDCISENEEVTDVILEIKRK